MKVHQILVEYRRDVTAQNLGDKLLTRLVDEPASTLPDELYDARSLVKYAMSPQTHGKGVRYMNMLGQRVVITQDDYAEVFEKYKMPIIAAVLQFIESRDPTPNKAYTQWLARSWINTKNIRLEDLNRANTVGLYSEGKRRNIIKPEDRDINRFRTYNEFENMVLNKYGIDTLDPEAAQRRAQASKGQAEQVYDDANVRVIHPQDERAACYYGQGTTWCTSATRGHNAFDDYNQSGPLFILIPKHPSYDGEKYQVHLASHQFMNEEDDMVDPTELMNKYPEFFELLKTKLDPENAHNNILFVPDEVIESLAQSSLDIAEHIAEQIVARWEAADDKWQVKKRKSPRLTPGDYAESDPKSAKLFQDIMDLRRWKAKDYRNFAISDEENYLSDLYEFEGFMGKIINDYVSDGDEIADYFYDGNVSADKIDGKWTILRKMHRRGKDIWVPADKMDLYYES